MQEYEVRVVRKVTLIKAYVSAKRQLLRDGVRDPFNWFGEGLDWELFFFLLFFVETTDKSVSREEWI